jgi:LmbE family N-acetylglucosaminyl deacetylase
VLDLIPALSGRDALRVLCIGAHCDDIEIGCGGTLLALQELGVVDRIAWVVLSGTEARRRETEHAMCLLVSDKARDGVVFGDFTDGSMPAEYKPIKAFFESLKDLPAPDLIFTHQRDDRHQDHRNVNEMTWNTFRDHLILEYEVPKWDGDLGQPNLYVPIKRELGERKISALLQAYTSQAGRDWFTRDTFEAIFRLRGLECRAESSWAEAFHARKLTVTARPRVTT